MSKLQDGKQNYDYSCNDEKNNKNENKLNVEQSQQQSD